MSGELTAYHEWLDQMRDAVREALLGLDADGLNWKPLSSGTNSVYNLAQHCAWVERWWIGTVIGGNPIYAWEGDEELEGSGEDSSDLLFWLDEAQTVTRTAMAELTADMLHEQRAVPRPNGPPRMRTLRWILIHVIEHYAEHIGQMRLTRQLWEAGKRET